MKKKIDMRKNHKWQAYGRRALAVLVTTVLLVSAITGCGRKEESSASGSQSGDYKNYVYRVEDLLSKEEVNRIERIFQTGDEFYTSSYRWNDDGSRAYQIFNKLNEDGSLGEEHRIEVDLNSNLSYITLDQEKNVYCINNNYGPVEGTEEYEDNYYLEKRTMDGEVLFSTKLNEIPQLTELLDGYFYVNNMIVVEEKGIYVNVAGNLAKFNFEGTFEKLIQTPQENGYSILDGASMFQLSDGRIAAALYQEEGVFLTQVDLEQGTVGEKYKLPGNAYDYSFYPGIGYDLYLTSSQGIYGYNLGEEDKTLLMNYIDSDCGCYNVFNITPLSETEFFAMYNGYESNWNTLAKFTKIPPSEVKEKKVITLGCNYTDFSVNKAVVQFNKSSEDYRITVQSYASLYNAPEDYQAGITRLNTDIVSGKMPDILVVDEQMPVSSYISKGIFEDLKPYIEKDEEMGLEDFMPNIIEAYSVDGKLYRLVPFYTIQTLLAKTSVVGQERGWTVEEAIALWDSMPEGTELLSRVDRNTMLHNCMTLASSQFIDWESGKCNFNSEGFIQMLEFLNRFPETVDETDFSDEYWQSYDAMWREGKTIASMTHIGDFRNYNYMEKGIFGEEVTMIGFPSADKEGSVISPNLEFAMSAKSKNKEGAWEFLRLFLLPEYQSSTDYWGFPLRIEDFDNAGELAMVRPSYEDENGKLVEYDDTYYIGGMEIVIEPMTAAEVDKLKQNISGVTKGYTYDENLINIIGEEAEAYFSGQKQAKDVADIIQSRVQIYVNETR